MGKQKVVSKVITAAELIKALQGGSITIAQAQQMYNGVIPIGDNNGIAALYDIDKQVIQPLVFAERQHILGVLDGRLEGHDLVTVNIPLGAITPVGTVYNGRLTVPAGEVWFITEVVSTFVAEAATPNAFWRCSLWPDGAAIPNVDGQSFNAAAMTFALGPAYFDDFFEGAGVFAPNTNKPVALRLPAGEAITLQLITTILGTAGSAHTLQLFGYIGKLLVV